MRAIAIRRCINLLSHRGVERLICVSECATRSYRLRDAGAAVQRLGGARQRRHGDRRL